MYGEPEKNCLQPGADDPEFPAVVESFAPRVFLSGTFQAYIGDYATRFKDLIRLFEKDSQQGVLA